MSDWRDCYRAPDRCFLRALRTLPEDPKFNVDSEAAYQFARVQLFLDSCERKGRLERFESVELTAAELIDCMNALQADLRDSIDHLDATFHEEASEEAAEMAISNIDLRFYMEVALPSIIEYHETADSLLNKAIQKDWNSLEKLARIDKWVTRFPEIYQLEDSGNQAEVVAYELATRPTKERPVEGQLDPQKVKVNLAAAMAHMSAGIGFTLTAPAIRELFDIIAKRYYGKDRDFDLPMDDRAFLKAIQRAKPAWQKVFPHPPLADIEMIKKFRKQLQASSKKPNRRKAA